MFFLQTDLSDFLPGSSSLSSVVPGDLQQIVVTSLPLLAGSWKCLAFCIWCVSPAEEFLITIYTNDDLVPPASNSAVLQRPLWMWLLAV